MPISDEIALPLAGATTHPKEGRLRSRLPKIKPYIVIAPSLLVLLVFWVYPIFEMVGLSFYKWDLISPVKQWVGLANYASLLRDATFFQALANTLTYTFFTVALSVGIGMAVALFLRKQTRANRFLQAVVFSPYVVSLASISLLWLWIMNKDYGLLNGILSAMGLHEVDWLGNPGFALGSLVAISVWKSVGYDSLILLSALQGIPDDLYEAASLDNADFVTTFRKITLPMLSPTVFFLVIVELIASLKVFETIQILTQGGPQNATNTLVFSLYQYGFQFNKVGYAAAIGVVLVVIIAIFSVLYFKVLERRVHYR